MTVILCYCRCSKLFYFSRKSETLIKCAEDGLIFGSKQFNGGCVWLHNLFAMHRIDCLSKWTFWCWVRRLSLEFFWDCDTCECIKLYSTCESEKRVLSYFISLWSATTFHMMQTWNSYSKVSSISYGQSSNKLLWVFVYSTHHNASCSIWLVLFLNLSKTLLKKKLALCRNKTLY